MENLAKSILTMAIWLFVGGIAITALIVTEGNGDPEGILIPSFLTSLMATFIIWGIPELAGKRGERQQVSSRHRFGQSKSKRNVSSSDERMSMLMALMTEDEREDFKETLKRRVLADSRLNADGEFMTDDESLDSLLYQDEHLNYNQR